VLAQQVQIPVPPKKEKKPALFNASHHLFTPPAFLE
jgi:hypothetical protein